MDEINAALKANVNLIAYFTDETPTKEYTYTFIKNKLGILGARWQPIKQQ